MDLREAIAKIEKERKYYEVVNDDYHDGKESGLESALDILRSVEGAWVDVSRNVNLNIDSCMLRCYGAMGNVRCLGRIDLKCVCYKTIGDSPDCPAVILKEG